MKLNLLLSTLVLVLATRTVSAQGTFVYDQQSADENGYLEGGNGVQPGLGQSFTPALSAVGFIRLYLYDSFLGSNSITLHLDLFAGSFAGSNLGSTAPVTLGDSFSGPTDFYFLTPLSVSPGSTYLFQPVVENGGGFGTYVAVYGYSGGTAFLLGSPSSAHDLWFREGIIVVPEPATWTLLALGLGALAWRKRSPP